MLVVDFLRTRKYPFAFLFFFGVILWYTNMFIFIFKEFTTHTYNIKKTRSFFVVCGLDASLIQVNWMPCKLVAVGTKKNKNGDLSPFSYGSGLG